MSEAPNSTTILDELTIGEPISQRQGVKCCPAICEATDERYIVKIISIPASSVQLDALLLTGAYSNPAHAMEYFHDRAKDVLKEVDVLSRLHAMEGFLPFTHAEIRKSEDGIGYQVYLVSPYKRSLERQMQLEPLTHLGAVNLGLDLCAALAICRRAGYLYIDLKPSNVFITPNQGYRISDLGFISVNSLKFASYPEQYRSVYTAPEIADAMSSLNARIDIYAVGLILYQIYNNGELPAQTDGPVPPPAYADYEMAEIILKACDPNPVKRWVDPLQMGQAIVAYMQRNSVNDSPIVPPPAEVPPEPEEEEPVQPEAEAEPEIIDDPGAILDSLLADIQPQNPDIENTADAEPAAEETVSEELPPEADTAEDADSITDLTFMEDGADDETVPTEESAADIAEELVSDEVQEMLARADVLLSHELPEPAVAPEPIDIPFPAPIILSDDEEAPMIAVPPAVDEEDSDKPLIIAEEPSQESTEEAADEAEAPDQDLKIIVDTEQTASDDQNSDWDEEDIEYRVSEYYSDDPDLKRERSGWAKSLAIIISCVAVIAALIISGILFYQSYYLQTVTSFTINGSVDSLTAIVTSSIDDGLLSVVCTDTYGNTRVQPVINGKAQFTDLTPSTQYRIQLHISGFHKLQGITSGSYTTATQTEILNFNAVAGPEDGSVILSFAVNGPDSETWTVAYATGNTAEIIQSFTGHTVTLSDLIVGSEYLFRLIPGEDQHLTGTWLLRYTAQQIVCAQELTIRSCADGILVAAWSVPDELEGQNWNVRCYNDNGFDQTITTTDCQAQFTDLDQNFGYTVEVTAVGMTQSATASVTANPITITSLTATPGNNNILELNWTYSGEAPAEGWILDYTVDGSAPITVACKDSTAQITRYPGSKYEIDVSPVGEVSCFNKHLSYEADAAVSFSNYGVTAGDMSFYMCRTPSKTNWDRFDVPKSEYTTTFQVGEKASFLLELWKSYQKSKDKITITYIIRDKDGVPVSLNTKEKAWNKLWDKKFCELDIPQMPEVAGEYTIDIFFNAQQINDDVLAFTVT